MVIVCRLANRTPLYEHPVRHSDDDVGRAQYDATVGSVTVYVDGNSGNRYAARPANDSQYNKVMLVFQSTLHLCFLLGFQRLNFVFILVGVFMFYIDLMNFSFKSLTISNI